MHLKKYRRYAMEKEFEELILKAKNGDLEAQTKIIEKYSKLVKFIADKYPTNAVLGKEDYYSEGCLGLIDAIERYDSSKGSFTTIAYYYIKKNIATLFRHNRKDFERHFQYMYDQIHFENDNGYKENDKVIADMVYSKKELSAVDLYIKNEEVSLLREAFKRLPLECKRVIKKRYCSGDEILTFAEMANDMGVTRQRVCAINKKAITIMKDIVNKEKIKEM